MKSLSVVLKQLRESRDVTILKLSEISGVANGTIGDIERGKSNGSKKTLEKLANALKLNSIEKDELYTAFLGRKVNESESLKSNATILQEETLISIPVMAKASAGNGYLNFSNQPLYNKLIRKNGFHEHCYLIEVSGNSMEPLIQDGAYVVVDPYQTDYIEGKVYVLKYADEVYIKRVILKPEAKVMILKSINPDYEDIYIPADQSDQIKIIGRAVKFIYEGNL